MTKVLSVLCAGLFALLLAGDAHAANVPPINPAQCQVPAACNDMNSLVVIPGNGTFCSVTGASPQTCNGTRGLVTTGTLTTAAATNAAYEIDNSAITAASVVHCTIQAYSGTIVTAGIPSIISCVAAAGKVTANITNVGANAMNGTVTISFTVEQN